jgi:hypothetical protein
LLAPGSKHNGESKIYFAVEVWAGIAVRPFPPFAMSAIAFYEGPESLPQHISGSGSHSQTVRTCNPLASNFSALHRSRASGPRYCNAAWLDAIAAQHDDAGGDAKSNKKELQFRRSLLNIEHPRYAAPQ